MKWQIRRQETALLDFFRNQISRRLGQHADPPSSLTRDENRFLEELPQTTFSIITQLVTNAVYYLPQVARRTVPGCSLKYVTVKGTTVSQASLSTEIAESICGEFARELQTILEISAKLHLEYTGCEYKVRNAYILTEHTLLDSIQKEDSLSTTYFANFFSNELKQTQIGGTIKLRKEDILLYFEAIFRCCLAKINEDNRILLAKIDEENNQDAFLDLRDFDKYPESPEEDLELETGQSDDPFADISLDDL